MGLLADGINSLRSTGSQVVRGTKRRVADKLTATKNMVGVGVQAVNHQLEKGWKAMARESQRPSVRRGKIPDSQLHQHADKIFPQGLPQSHRATRANERRLQAEKAQKKEANREARWRQFTDGLISVGDRKLGSSSSSREVSWSVPHPEAEKPNVLSQALTDLGRTNNLGFEMALQATHFWAGDRQSDIAADTSRELLDRWANGPGVATRYQELMKKGKAAPMAFPSIPGSTPEQNDVFRRGISGGFAELAFDLTGAFDVLQAAKALKGVPGKVFRVRTPDGPGKVASPKDLQGAFPAERHVTQYAMKPGEEFGPGHGGLTFEDVKARAARHSITEIETGVLSPDDLDKIGLAENANLRKMRQQPTCRVLGASDQEFEMLERNFAHLPETAQDYRSLVNTLVVEDVPRYRGAKGVSEGVRGIARAQEGGIFLNRYYLNEALNQAKLDYNQKGLQVFNESLPEAIKPAQQETDLLWLDTQTHEFAHLHDHAIGSSGKARSEMPDSPLGKGEHWLSEYAKNTGSATEELAEGYAFLVVDRACKMAAGVTEQAWLQRTLDNKFFGDKYRFILEQFWEYDLSDLVKASATE